MENNSTLEKILLAFNKNTELLRLVGATFYSKVASVSQKDDEEKLDHSRKYAERKAFGHFLFYLFCRCLHLSCQISISLNILYLTVLYLKFFSIL